MSLSVDKMGLPMYVNLSLEACHFMWKWLFLVKTQELCFIYFHFPFPSHNHPSKTNKTWDTGGDARTVSAAPFSYGLLHMDTLGKNGERESKNCVLLTQIDDDVIYIYYFKYYRYMHIYIDRVIIIYMLYTLLVIYKLYILL